MLFNSGSVKMLEVPLPIPFFLTAIGSAQKEEESLFPLYCIAIISPQTHLTFKRIFTMSFLIDATVHQGTVTQQWRR